MEHKVNKGVDRGVEFSGLQAQYLYILAGGLLSVFLVFVILYGTVSASVLVLAVFRLGRKYGPHGLMKLAAAKYRPFHIINRKRIISLFKRSSHEKHPESGNTGK